MRTKTHTQVKQPEPPLTQGQSGSISWVYMPSSSPWSQGGQCIISTAPKKKKILRVSGAGDRSGLPKPVAEEDKAPLGREKELKSKCQCPVILERRQVLRKPGPRAKLPGIVQCTVYAAAKGHRG
jgi:hypothetical protein